MKPIITLYDIPTAGTTHTFNTKMRWATVIVTGGGSSGDKRSNADQWLGRNGAPGATSIHYFLIEDVNTTATVIVGAKGTRNVSIAAGSSSFSSGSVLVSAEGGVSYGTAFYTNSLASGGTYNLKGIRPMGHKATDDHTSGRGMGQWPAPYWNGLYGSGGSCGSYLDAVDARLDGGDGVVMVEEYI